jgi:hypothetical protein
MIILLAVLGYAFGCVGGIAWCLLDYPDSPRAPLFGLFITGPVGLFLGIIASVVVIVWAITSSDDKNKRTHAAPHPE